MDVALPDPSWISVIPPLLAVVLAFATKQTMVSLGLACVVGVLLLGQGLAGFPRLLTRALGSESFIWICGVEVCIGVMVAFLQRCGATRLFTQHAGRWARSRRQVGVLGWLLGLLIFFSDYFSPLFVGPVMRDLTDSHRISREKLAYICDSTSAPLMALLPMTGWAVYLAGLAAPTVGGGDISVAMSVFVHSIPLNFYGILAIVMVGLIAAGIVPDYGPMRAAERRCRETGKVMRDGARPMMDKELTELPVSDSTQPTIFWNFFAPVIIIVGFNISSFVMWGTAAVLESFMLACLYLGAMMWAQKVDDLEGLIGTAMIGIKGIVPAALILALAYCINTLSQEMRTAEFVVSATGSWMSPMLLPGLIFVMTGFISFATGTAWGAYAIMVPVALPLAVGFAGDPESGLVLASFAAVAGGGIFGDHCSPLSDTTVLSSLGSACDHLDHVKTQLPYTLTVGAVVVLLYLLTGALV